MTEAITNVYERLGNETKDFLVMANIITGFEMKADIKVSNTWLFDHQLTKSITDVFGMDWKTITKDPSNSERILARQLYSWYMLTYTDVQRYELLAILKRDRTTINGYYKSAKDFIDVKDSWFMAKYNAVNDILFQI